jgi:simple sugar transport system substrate-binding protein
VKEPGTYAVFVGSLTVPLHNKSADAGIKWIEENCADKLKPIGDRYGVAESVDDSRSTALDIIAARPDLRGFLAFGSQGPIGAGRAIEERRRSGEIFVLGPFSPGQGRKLVKSGTITGGFMWNPAEAGRVFVTLGKMLADGQTIEDGADVPGLGVVHPDVANRDIITDNLLEINAETVDALADKGL